VSAYELPSWPGLERRMSDNRGRPREGERTWLPSFANEAGRLMRSCIFSTGLSDIVKRRRWVGGRARDDKG
jgi:hypothetical protein